jgi:hypothetical protein
MSPASWHQMMEEKDTGPDGASFYLAQGVQDVLVINPCTNTMQHYQPHVLMHQYPTPRTFDLTCGCRVRIPA